MIKLNESSQKSNKFFVEVAHLKIKENKQKREKIFLQAILRKDLKI